MKYQDYLPDIAKVQHKLKVHFEILHLALYTYDNIEIHSVKISRYEYNKNKRLYSTYKVINVDFDDASYKEHSKKYDDYYDKLQKSIKNNKLKYINDLAKETNTNIDTVNKAIRLLEYSLEEFAGVSFQEYINEHYMCPANIKYDEYMFNREVDFLKDYIMIIK